MIGNRQGGVSTQLAVIKLIPQPVEPPDDSTGDQLYYLQGTGLLLKDRSGVVIPFGKTADGVGVTAIDSADSPYTLREVDEVLLVDTSGGAVTVTLPADGGPKTGRALRVIDSTRSFATNACTLDGNTKTINGAATLVLNTTDGGTEIVWNGTTWSRDAVGAATLNGTTTMPDGSLLQMVGAGTGTGDVIQRIGGTTTEGLELRVIDVTVSPAAVETAVATLPAGSVVISVQGNVQSALTGGGTTVTWSLGVAADPDKYGTAGYPSAADALTKNSKSRWLGPFTQLASAEAIVLTGAATGGAADGDTALTVGSVRVRIVYWTCNDLDDAP